MDRVIVWVLARSADKGLPVLDEAEPGATFVVGSRPGDFDGQPEADAILACSNERSVVEPVFGRARKARWVHCRSAGLDTLLFPALVESSVVLTNGRGVFSRSLAEFVIGAVFFFTKDFRRLVESQHRGSWEPFEPADVAGRTLGIVGYGDIGRAIAERARPLGMRILALRRRPERSRRDPLVDEALPPEALMDLVGRADDVVVAMPLTPESRGFVGQAAIGAMKRTSVLINVGRGPVVQEAALVRALEEGRIRGAALDVFETEPLPAGHAFYRLKNVLLSPHCADNTPGWLDAAMRCFLHNLGRFRRGEDLENVVDKTLGY
jgi:phosphoglycerate dehydrogenase-like enzyme